MLHLAGGYSENGTILKSVENYPVSLNWTGANLGYNDKWPDMLQPRCSRLGFMKSEMCEHIPGLVMDALCWTKKL